MYPIRATRIHIEPQDGYGYAFDGYSVEYADGYDGYQTKVVSAHKALLMSRVSAQAQAAIEGMEILADRLSQSERAELDKQQAQSRFYKAMAKVIKEASDGY